MKNCISLLALAAALTCPSVANAQITTDINGNTSIGPGTITFGGQANGNLVATPQGGNTSIGIQSDNNLVVGNADIGYQSFDNQVIGSASIGYQSSTNQVIGSATLGYQTQNNQVLGSANIANQSNSNVAVGTNQNISGSNNIALGAGAEVSGSSSIVLGTSTGQQSTLSNTTVIGSGAGQNSSLSGSTVVGASAGNQVSGANNVLIGDGAGSSSSGSLVSVSNGTALGSQSSTADSGTAIGANSAASSVNSVALGAGSIADRNAGTYAPAQLNSGTRTSAGSVSVGSVGQERQVTNVAAGTALTDAANIEQLNAGVANANAYTDAQVAAASSQAAAADAATLNQANTYTNQATANTVVYDTDASGNRTGTITLAGSAPVQISNVANGIAATDAANVGQVQASAAQTLTQANSYTDAQVAAVSSQIAAGDAATLNQANSYTNTQVASVSSQIAAGDVATLNQANAYTNQATANAVQYDTGASGNRTGTITLAGSAPVQISNVANGIAATDAANVGQVQASAAQTLTQANSYTDTQVATVNSNIAAGDAATLNQANAYTDSRINQLNLNFDSINNRIDGLEGQLEGIHTDIRRLGRRVDASVALGMAAGALPEAHSEGRSLIGVGVGSSSGEQAIAVGVSHRFRGDRVTFNGRLAAATRGPAAVGLGLGIELGR